MHVLLHPGLFSKVTPGLFLAVAIWLKPFGLPGCGGGMAGTMPVLKFLTEDEPWLADALLAVRLAGFVGKAHRSAVWCALACSRGAPDTTY
jgi:hypothetical protein